MSGTENNEYIDADILECKEDILRARDVIPPFDKSEAKEPRNKSRRESTPSQGVSGKERDALADTGAISIEADDAPDAAPLTADETPENKDKKDKGRPEVPQFDLADDLMAAHRKVTAGKRRPPAEKTKQPAKIQKQPPAAKDIEKPPVSQQEDDEDRIIAQIVARDIEKLYRGQSP